MKYKLLRFHFITLVINICILFIRFYIGPWCYKSYQMPSLVIVGNFPVQSIMVYIFLDQALPCRLILIHFDCLLSQEAHKTYWFDIFTWASVKYGHFITYCRSC